MVALTLFINKTRMGKAMRAVSEDKRRRRADGHQRQQAPSPITFAIGSALAAVAGIFYGATYIYIGPYTGSMPGIKAFVAAVFGGIGSIPGAMLGGLALRPDREPVQGVHLHRAVRRDCVRGADRGADRQAHRPAGQEDF